MTQLQSLPPLSKWDLDELRESIRTQGVREPMVVDEFGKIIDGHHRKQIADELGIECPERVVSGLTEPEKWDLAYALNVPRRHLTVEQRRQVIEEHKALVAHLLIEQPTRSDRSIGEQIGLHHTTVGRVRDELESSGAVATTEFQPHYGGGTRVEGEPKAENHADHRNEVWFELTVGYPCPSDEIRKRGDKPYPQESDRLIWPSGRLYLVNSAPTNDGEANNLANEIGQRVSREIRARPMKTMARSLP